MNKKFFRKVGYISLIAVFTFLLFANLNIDLSWAKELTLTILHINDTHSHWDPSRIKIKVDGKNSTYVYAGGYAKIANFVKEVRAKEKNVLFLHGGDFLVGTIYFSQFDGLGDIKILNEMGFDAAVLGNHEFDKGAEKLAKNIVDNAKFPLLSANIDFSGIPDLKEKIKPYIIKEIDGEKVGIIGLTTPDTEKISNPGNKVKFEDYIAVAQKMVDELKEKGVNKIIVLSHLGYRNDKILAEKVEDIDIIVGGHSHTLLGSFGKLHLFSQGPYPTVIGNNGKPVLIVQAWEYGKVVGDLKVKFDDNGVITCWSNSYPVLLLSDKFLEKNKEGKKVKVSPEREKALKECITKNPFLKIESPEKDILAVIDTYKEKVKELKKKVIAQATANLYNTRVPGSKTASGIVLRNGSLIAPHVALGILEKTKPVGVQIVVQNAGGVRKDILKGGITVLDVYELLPFGNTIVVMDISGKKLREAIETGIDTALTKASGAFPYLAGARIKVDLSKPKGERIVSFEVKENGKWVPLDPNKTYRIATNSFLAHGGDFYTIFKNVKGYKEDLGFVDADVFMEYLEKVKKIGILPKDEMPIINVTPQK